MPILIGTPASKIYRTRRPVVTGRELMTVSFITSKNSRAKNVSLRSALLTAHILVIFIMAKVTKLQIL